MPASEEVGDRPSVTAKQDPETLVLRGRPRPVVRFRRGLIIGVVESLSGLFLGESLGQIGIFLIFILVLLFRPTGLFGARA